MAESTKGKFGEPLEWDASVGAIVDSNGCAIAFRDEFRGGLDGPERRRIIACVNACDGISTEDLEGGALVDVAKTLVGDEPTERAKRAVSALLPD